MYRDWRSITCAIHGALGPCLTVRIFLKCSDSINVCIAFVVYHACYSLLNSFSKLAAQLLSLWHLKWRSEAVTRKCNTYSSSHLILHVVCIESNEGRAF